MGIKQSKCIQLAVQGPSSSQHSCLGHISDFLQFEGPQGTQELEMPAHPSLKCWEGHPPLQAADAPLL